ncbi:methyl-accepting chemotaxis protein [Pseudidiomarina planktonica]|nr:methyl-accepting chemotaxis protein [Pseudidiomarina planktonica]
MLRNLTLGLRFTLAFGLIGLVVLGLGIFAIVQTNNLGNQLNYVTDQRAVSLELVSRLDSEFLRARVHTANLQNAANQEQIAYFEDKLASARDAANEIEQQLRDIVHTDEAKTLFERYLKLDERYWQLQQEYIDLEAADREEEAIQLRQNVQLPLTEELSMLLDDFMRYEVAAIDNVTIEADESRAATFTALVTVIVFTTIIIVFMSIVLTRSVIRPLRGAVEIARRIARKDLTHDFKVEGNDEVSTLIGQLKETQQSLRDSIGTIADSATQLATTSEELNSVTDESARNIQEQSQQLEQAATAVNELTVAIETVAQDAQSASESSDYADEKAQQGRAQVSETVDAIGELSERMTLSSESVNELATKVNQITKVLEVIRGIADQTNLLALNAAIEAARAGESGRGFSVVADEVRALASRTQTSTVEIEELVEVIKNSSTKSVSDMDVSVERAKSTLEIATDAGKALGEIAIAVAEINNRNTSIASAAEEQAAVSKDVDGNLVSIRDLSDSTSSGAEQTSSSAAELSRLATRLSELTDSFKV